MKRSRSEPGAGPTWMVSIPDQLDQAAVAKRALTRLSAQPSLCQLAEVFKFVRFCHRVSIHAAKISFVSGNLLIGSDLGMRNAATPRCLKGREGANSLGGHMSTAYESLKEINDLKSKIDVLANQITQLDTTIQQAKAETDSEAKRAQQLAENSSAKIATLEAELRDREEIVRAKESTLKGLEQNLTAKIQDLESQVKNKEKLLADQDRRVNDLNSQLETLTNGIKGMSSFFKQAEALTAVEAQGDGTVVPGQPLKGEIEKPANSQYKSDEVTYKPAGADK